MHPHQAQSSLLVLAGAIACTDQAPLPAAVYFVLAAPACRSILPIEFLLDDVVAGSDTFRGRGGRVSEAVAPATSLLDSLTAACGIA